MSMPVMDGMSATRAIREYEQTHNIAPTCIIALTGLASSSAKLEAWSSGIDHFMTKPVNFRELGEILKSKEAKRQDRKGQDTKRPMLSVRPATADRSTTGSEPVH
jgi:CheY-like chemotaxis protein